MQGLLSRAGDEHITIGALARMELDALGTKEAGDRITLDGAAAQFGRLDARAWSVRKANGEGRRPGLEWVEEGLDKGWEERTPARKGYGRELVERASPYALDAQTGFELRETGVHCTIDLPLSSRSGSRSRA